MMVRDLAGAKTAEGRVLSATLAFEDQEFPPQRLFFAIADEEDALPSADPFLAASFPLAAVHGERRVFIEHAPCPMLVEGLRTVHAWWADWGGMPGPAPLIETPPRKRPQDTGKRARAFGFVSGGVDGLHMLMHNRQTYGKDDPASIRQILFIHGFDIGKKAGAPQQEHFRMAQKRLEPLAAESGVHILPCRSNLRQLPTKRDFWTHRYNVGALAAVGHAAAVGPSFLFVAGAYPLSQAVPMGTHPAVDGLYSSERVRVLHEGARFSRLDKIRDLATWPSALAALRVCPVECGEAANCRRCEKCLVTRLELLAAGVEETLALGPSLCSVEEWEAALPVPIGHRALRYGELLAPLRARGHLDLCAMLEGKIALYRQRVESGLRWPGL